MSETPTTDPPVLPPAGWFPDPLDPGKQRWWSGAEWTDHIADASTGLALSMDVDVPRDVPEELTYVPMADHDPTAWDPSAPLLSTVERGNTLAVWLLVFSPLVFSFIWVMEFLYYWSPNGLSVPLPAALLIFVGVLALECILLFITAIVDFVILKKRGIRGPNPVWLFLSVLAYLIVRRVALNRYGIRRSAPGSFALYAIVLLGSAVAGFLIPTTMIAVQARVDSIRNLEQHLTFELDTPTSAGWVVTCPDDSPVFTRGATFDCTAAPFGGNPIRIPIEVINPGNFSIKLDFDAVDGHDD
jgi:Protein of unknown function (DUF2510)